MSIRSQHSTKNLNPDYSINKHHISATIGMDAKVMHKNSVEINKGYNSDIVVLKTGPNGHISDSIGLLKQEGQKLQNIAEIFQGKEFIKVMRHIQHALKVQSVFSKKITFELPGAGDDERTIHYVPIKENEVLIIIGKCFAERDISEKIDTNLKTMIQMLEFLPGETLIADANHRLLNLPHKNKCEKFCFDENKQIGPFIGCAHYLEGGDNCGSLPACSKCDLQAAIQMVEAYDKDLHNQSIRLALRINNQVQFKDFSLSVSQALVDGKKYFVIYLEDSNSQKVKIQKLQDSNELLRNVLDSLPFSVYWKNRNSTFLGGNQRFLEDNKIKCQDYIFGQRDEQLYGFDTARENQKQDEIVLKIDKPLWNCENNQIDSSSRKNNFKSILKDSSGRKIGLVGASINLAQQNWFQVHGSDCKAVQNSGLPDLDGLGVFDWFLKIDMLKGNAQFQTIAGGQNQSVFLEDLLSNIEDDNEGKKMSDIKRQIENKGEYRFLQTVKYLHPIDKTIKWLEISGQKLYKDFHGKSIKVTCLIKDVTAKKQKELTQQNVHTFHAAFLDSTKDAIWSIDKNYLITTLNKSFRANYLMAFGVELEIGSCCLEALDKSMKNRWLKRYDKALRSNAFKVVDHLDYEGIRQTAETILSPIKIDDQIVGVSCFSRDISIR